MRSERLSGDAQVLPKVTHEFDIEADGGIMKSDATVNAARELDRPIDAGLFQRKHRLGGVEGISDLNQSMPKLLRAKPTAKEPATSALGQAMGKVAAIADASFSGDSGDESHTPVRKKKSKKQESVFAPLTKMLSGVSSSALVGKSSGRSGADMYRFESGPSIALQAAEEGVPLLQVDTGDNAVDSELGAKFVSKSMTKKPANGSFDTSKVAVLDQDVEFSDDDEVDEDGNKINRDIEVIERGYAAQDEFFLDNEQKGRLIGVDSVHVCEIINANIAM